MSNLIDVLLSADKSKFTEQETKTIELKRLTKLTGTKFEISVKSISHREYKDIYSRANKIGKKGVVKMDLALTSELILIAGIVDPDLKNEKLLKHFGCYSANELIDKLFTAGEITLISDIILEISGITDDEIDEFEEIKKL